MSNPDDSKKDDVLAREDKNDDVSAHEDKRDDVSAGEEKKDDVSSPDSDKDSSDKDYAEEVTSSPSKSDDFFEDPENRKKKSSPLIPFIILIFLCGAFLVFGYIYNIAGIRNKASAYDFEKIPKYFNAETSDITAAVTEPSDSVENTPEERDVSDSANEGTNNVPSEAPDAEAMIAQIDDSKDQEIEENVATDVNAEEGDITETVIEAIIAAPEPIREPVIQTVTEYVPAYALSKEDFVAHKEKIRALNKEIYSGKTYINQLVAVKGLFPELDLSTMTEYSAVGKPKKFAVAQDGINAVKRAAVLQEVKTDAEIKDIAGAILRKFVVITPVENIDESHLEGQLSLIKNAFMAGDFKVALKYISILPEDREAEFARVVKVINDTYSLKAEMRQIDDALTEKLYNNKKN